MVRLKGFRIPPFLNAMSVETIQADPLDTAVYPFNVSYFVRLTQYHMTRCFQSGSTVTSVLSSSNVKPILKDQSANINRTLEVALVGRSNCGKSSLINSLLNEQVAMTSKTPGKTQQLICHTLLSSPADPISLVDAPGYGYARAPIDEMNKWKEIAQEYFTKSPQLMNTLVLVDSRTGLMDSDKILFEMLNECKRHSTIVLTKADCLNNQSLKDIMIRVGEYAAKSPRIFPTVFATSSKLGYGIKELQTFVLYHLFSGIGKPNHK